MPVLAEPPAAPEPRGELHLQDPQPRRQQGPPLSLGSVRDMSGVRDMRDINTVRDMTHVGNQSLKQEETC